MITIVTGLPRSGTSMTMQMLVAGGLPALVDKTQDGKDKTVTDELNPHGYIEYDAVKWFIDKPELVMQAEGKCLKVISEWLFGLPQGMTYKVLMTDRAMSAVVSSQWQWIEKRFRFYIQVWRNAADRDKVALQYAIHLEHCRFFLKARHIPVYIVKYEDVLQNPLRVAVEIQTFLEIPLNTTAMANAVDKNLWRNK